MEHEGKSLRVDQYIGQHIAVVTSGGDSQGMNPTLRAIVRAGLYVGCKIYFVHEGYTGLINGDANIVEATWNSVSSIIHKGGTIIGSARSEEFKTDEGQLKVVRNLVQRGISNLIVIGGDGSLTGADKLRRRWPEFLKKLKKAGEITNEQVLKLPAFRVVGLVGTIDNDFTGTDMTIGTDSALHRIQEAIFALASTAYSHKRTFILEIMGRHCGYLALKSALTTEADYLFIPEFPPPDNWPEKIEKRINESAGMGKRIHMIILSEGAVDRENKPITSTMVRNVLADKLKLDARITVLGHVQRGGSPSAYDRILGSRSGVEAVIALMELKPDAEPIVIGTNLNRIIRIPLSTCIQQIEEVKQALEAREYEKAIELRGRAFSDSLGMYLALNRPNPSSAIQDGHTYAILQIGTPAGGMNSTVHAFVRITIKNGGKVLGVFGGVEGLVYGNFEEIKWSDVNELMFEGGSYLGTKRMVPPDDLLPLVAENFKKFKIDALLIVGGFEAFVTANNLVKNRSKHSEFCIPIAVIPATTSNNMPGTNFAIGADTALNSLCKTCDLFRQSAMGTKNRVFVVETMGGRCGYLCSVGAMASGADSSYIFEEPFNIDDLVKDVRDMTNKMKSGGVKRGLVLRNECCNDNYTTDFMTKLYSEEGKEEFSTRKNIPGHIQQGDIPSSFDRGLAVKLSVRASVWFRGILDSPENAAGKVYANSPDSAVVVGLVDNGYAATPIEELLPTTDFFNRFSRSKWWLNLRTVSKILAQYDTVYRTGKK